MGKKPNKPNHLLKPFVSVCTPTFNRRPFIKMLIKCFENQTYPKDRMEWIIIDDGSDKIEDLVKDIPQVRYFSYAEQMVLGKKRNLMHEKCEGDIIVYMDDDDYYPPERVSHSVEMLLSHPKSLCAGSSELYIYFKHINSMYQFGPYGKNHATAGTFAFKKELLKNTSYNDSEALAEERYFLKDYTIPFVQLEPKKTILVFSHIHNTFDKKKLLDVAGEFVKLSDKNINYFIKDEKIIDFYINIDKELENYEPGNNKNKPEVLKQTEELVEKYKKQNMVNSNNSNISNNLNDNNNFIELIINNKKVQLGKEEVLSILKNQNESIVKLEKQIKIQESIINSYRSNKEIEKQFLHDDMIIINQINN